MTINIIFNLLFLVEYQITKLFDGKLTDVFHEFFKTFLGAILRFFSAFNYYLWILDCTHVVMVMRGMTFHPMVCSIWTKGLYLLDFSLVAMLGNVLWQ